MEKLRRMKIRKRLVKSFIYTVVLSGLGGVVCLIMLLILNNRYSTALELNGFIQGDIGEYNTYLNRGGAMTRDIIVLDEAGEKEEAEQELALCDEKVAYYIDVFEGMLETEEEKQLLSEIKKEYPVYLEYREQAITVGQEEDCQKGLEIFREQAAPHLRKIMADSEALLSYNVQRGDEISQRLDRMSRIAILIVVILMFGAISGAMKFALYTAKDIEDPILKVQEGAIKMARGELDFQLNIDGENEFKEMADYMNVAISKIHKYLSTIKYGLEEVGKGNFLVRPDVEFEGTFILIKEAIENIINNLNTAMLQINDGSEQVAVGASQLAESAQTLADGATHQALAVEELTQTIESVADAAEESANKASGAHEEAKKYAQIAEEGNQELKMLTDAMERITQTSKKIEVIISEIEDIASQTNLLSLNASIEAARAGDAGRGFAVVADQIGKLASDSAQYAIDTRNLIAESISEIGKGNDITIKTASSLQQVMHGMEEMAVASEETSLLLSQQSTTMATIRKEIAQIADVIRDNSAAAEQTSATSEELLAYSEALKELVGYFQLIEEQ